MKASPKRNHAWINDAACRGMNTDLFYPDLDTEEYSDLNMIKNVCNGCPVKVNCLDYALMNKDNEDGYWAVDKESRASIKKNIPSFRTYEPAAQFVAAQLSVLELNA